MDGGSWQAWVLIIWCMQYMNIGLGSVRIVKNCGLRPRAAFSRPRSQFFTIRTSQPANNTYISLTSITYNMTYYTTSSASGQDEPNLALWLATRAGKIELSCPLGLRVMSRKEHLSCYGVLSRIINPLLTKLVRSKWLDIGLVLFFACLWTETKSRSINTQKTPNHDNTKTW